MDKLIKINNQLNDKFTILEGKNVTMDTKILE